MDALTQQFLLKHGDVLTIRTLHSNSTGQPGWLYLDANETPQIAHGIDLPVSDKKFQWQVLKLSPNTTGGNQNPTYVTEGDDVILKSLSNGLVLAFHGGFCGLNSAKAQVGEQIALGNYYTSGQGSTGTVRFVDMTGGVTQDRAVIYGLRPYAIKFAAQHCFLSTPPHDQGKTASSASINEQFILLPPWGSLKELEMRAAAVGPVPLIKQETAGQGVIDATDGNAFPFAQQVPSQGSVIASNLAAGGSGSALTTSIILPWGTSNTPYYVSAVVLVILVAVAFFFVGRKTKKQN